MLQVLKKIAERVTDPIRSISDLANAGIDQHQRTVELEARVDRLSRIVLLLCMKTGVTQPINGLPALQNRDKPIDLTITFDDGEDGLTFTVSILQGQPEETSKDRPMNFGAPRVGKSRTRE